MLFLRSERDEKKGEARGESERASEHEKIQYCAIILLLSAEGCSREREPKSAEHLAGAFSGAFHSRSIRVGFGCVGVGEELSVDSRAFALCFGFSFLSIAIDFRV